MDQLRENLDEDQAKPAIGDRIKAAREQAGLSLAQVSAETRISQRHIEMIEAGKFGDLPARTYAVGFSRTIARLVGLDENEVVADVRTVLDEMAGGASGRGGGSFEPGDPARIPSARLGWYTALGALALLLAGFLFFRSFFSPAAELPPLVSDPQPVTGQVAPAASPATVAAAPVTARGAVVFTALADGIWVKFYDAQGRQLMQKQMALGESYTVPADSEGPMVRTARPDALEITVGGRKVAPLAESQRLVKDIPVTAEALLAPRVEPETDYAAAPAVRKPAAATQPATSPVATAKPAAQPRSAPAGASAPAVQKVPQATVPVTSGGTGTPTPAAAPASPTG